LLVRDSSFSVSLLRLTFHLADDQALMMQRFAAAMAKMALLGQTVSKLHDCSDVIPQPTLAIPGRAKLPEGKTVNDLQITVSWMMPDLP
jgi:hypothetical protein